LSGAPTIVRQDGCVCFSWDYGAPDAKITRDNFSVRWTRSIFLDRAGKYIFRIQHDDGMRVYVDGKIIYDAWYDQSVTYNVRKLPLKEGYRTFVVEYYEHTGQAVAQVSIDGDPGDYGDDSSDSVGIIVDNTGPNFQWGGPGESRYVATGGQGENYYWTHNSSGEPINSGRWTAPISEAGNYEIYAYIPGGNATTANARYIMHHFGKWDERGINQASYQNEFVSLGIYYFGADANEFVVLKDNTGEGAGSRRIAFDALKFVRR
jgi:hypothetical protein